MIAGSEKDVSPLLCEELQGAFDDLVVVRDVPGNNDAIVDVCSVREAGTPAIYAFVGFVAEQVGWHVTKGRKSLQLGPCLWCWALPVKILLVVCVQVTDAMYAHSLWANCPAATSRWPSAKCRKAKFWR